MTLVAHLIRKDLRAVALVAAIWIVMMAIEVAAVFTGRIARPLSSDPPSQLAFLMGVLAYVEAVVIVSIVSMVIHEDPVLDPRAFWVTRPISRGQLFAAKLITLAVVIFVPVLAAFGILFVRYDVPFAYMSRAGVDVVVSTAVPLLLLTVAATLTPSLTRFVMLIAGAFVVLITASLFRPGSGRDEISLLLNVHDPTPGVFISLIAIAGLCAVIHQCYRRRDWRVGFGGVVLVFGLAITVDSYWPDYRPFEWPAEVKGAWTDPSVTLLRLLDDRQLVTTHQRELSTLAAPLVLDGLPDGYAATPYTLGTQLTRPDGTVLRSVRSAPPETVGASGEYHPSQVHGLRDRWGDEGPPRWNTWATLLSLQSGHRAAAGAPTGRNTAGDDAAGDNAPDDAAYYSGAYAGTFIYWIARQEKVAALRLDEGHTYADGPRRIGIVEAADLDGLCRATLEVSNAGLRFAGPREPFTRYYFVDRQTGARLQATEKGRSFRPAGPFPNAHVFRAAFVQWDIEHPRGGSAGDASPCGDMELIFLRTSAVGTMTRSLALPDFRLQSLSPSPRPWLRQ